ncbi:hypothetical protein OBBRIDRAFT_791925 [Obba rivulosa]|uniref:Uncharacterized protein n=1 Tax=Obba rivulosa TaxID=1052685 RepID=A0A8E2DLR0_9APHY|nr:hypothetical protein OBBRIDRAFT_791925 [Obba rivulosa]
MSRGSGVCNNCPSVGENSHPMYFTGAGAPATPLRVCESAPLTFVSGRNSACSSCPDMLTTNRLHNSPRPHVFTTTLRSVFLLIFSEPVISESHRRDARARLATFRSVLPRVCALPNSLMMVEQILTAYMLLGLLTIMRHLLLTVLEGVPALHMEGPPATTRCSQYMVALRRSWRGSLQKAGSRLYG